MVSEENLLNYLDWIIPSTINMDTAYKHLGAVISQNNTPNVFFSGILSKIKHKRTTI